MFGAGVAAVLALTLLMPVAAPASADVICVDDGCDGGLWQAARGAHDEISYWGMGAGHNCTNYVAWKLSTLGVARPRTSQGDAADWASNAIADGYPVDSVPAVGAVAQWNAFADGAPLEGHVAYVEQVNDDGTILVSEDAWRANGSGPLKFRTVPVSEVSNFIHYGDLSQWLRTVVAAPSTWAQTSTTLAARPTALSAVSMGGRSPVIAYTQDGQLRVARQDQGVWHRLDTGLASSSSTLSAVNMGGWAPMIMSLENGKLYSSTLTHAGWQSLNTGLEISGEISAVNAGGTDPTVMVSQGGSLYRIDRGPHGWHVTSTGLESTGPISAVSTAGGDIDVFSIEGGMIVRMWSDGTWWYKDSTGIPANGTLAAVGGDGSTQLMLSEGGMLFTVYRDPLGWHKQPTGVQAGTHIAAVDLGGIYPVVVQAG